MRSDVGTPIPHKLSFVGVSGTPTPSFGSGDLPRVEGRSMGAFNHVMSLDGEGMFPVPPGRYDIHVSRGPEWSVSVHRAVHVRPAGATLTATLRHEVTTDGWLSGDFHVHSASSFDSRVPMAARIYEFVSDGVELLVATDHNVISDYGPIITSLGAEDLITTLTGEEVTTAHWGHFGAFPLPQRQAAAGHGAVATTNRTPKQIFEEVREVQPDSIIDVHHPRFKDGIGYFELGRFTPGKNSMRPGFALNFDAIEVLNGYQDTARLSVDDVTADWFALLREGVIFTATGNSDTHHLDQNLGGYPRNYLRLLHDAPSTVEVDEVVRAVRTQHALFTTGPFVRLRCGNADIGEVAPAPGGEATVSVQVLAANWVDVTGVDLIVNGDVVKHWVVEQSTTPLRLDESYTLELTKDSFALVRVIGDRPMAPIVGDLEKFVVRPFAMTNAMLFDVDGNGGYDPPPP